MLRRTHSLAGAISGYVVCPNLAGILIGSLAGVIADVDEPKGSVGRSMLLISYPLNRAVGHRTFTHSILFSSLLFVFTLMITAIASSMLHIHFTFEFAWAVLASTGSHILLDMLTGRVAVFWPSKKKIGIKMPLSMYFIVDKAFFVCLFLSSIFVVFYHWRENTIVSSLLAWLQ